MPEPELQRPGLKLDAPPELPASHCADCRYGICTHALPARCPMCGGKAWARTDLWVPSRAKN
jgi:hypothetical protein